MSNLIKYNYVYLNSSEKKVVDSNDLSKKLLPQGFTNFEDKEEGFTAGIPAMNVEVAEPEEEQQPEEIIKQADEIVREAEEEARTLIMNARAEAQTEKEEILAKAREDGYTAGYQEGMEAAEKEKEKYTALQEEYRHLYEEQLSQLEPEFAELTISLIEKITGVIIRDKKDVIMHILHGALTNANNSKEFIIHVSKEDYGVVAAKKNELYDSVKEETKLEIIEDQALGKNQCLIETDTKIIDCSLDVQLKNLADDLKLLANT